MEFKNNLKTYTMHNETKHTAGNWATVQFHKTENTKRDYCLFEEGNTLGFIANIQFHNRPDEEVGANIKLIKAAPELLETLQRTFKRLEAFRNECLQEDSQEREIIIDIETDILDKIRKATRVS